MCSKPSVIPRVWLVIIVLASFPAWPEDTTKMQPEVRAVLFFSPDSAQYQDLFAYYLPGLLERHKDRLEVSAIDTSASSGATAYHAATANFDLPLQLEGKPAVLVGNRSMVGLMEIGRMLGDKFEEVASIPGAASWPLLPGLKTMLPAGKRDLKARTASEGASPIEEDPNASAGEASTADRIADVLALAVLLTMVLVLVHSLFRLSRPASNSRPTARVVLLLALLAGLGISGYTTYTALADVVPMCGAGGGCGTVQQSEYAKLFGIPMGVFGLVGYASILITWLVAQHLSPKGGRWCWLPWALAFAAMLFSLRLTALAYFVIGATCLWCLGSALSISVVLWLLSGQTRMP